MPFFYSNKIHRLLPINSYENWHFDLLFYNYKMIRIKFQQTYMHSLIKWKYTSKENVYIKIQNK